MTYSRSRERWRATITIGWDDDGKQRRRESFHRTEPAAKAWLDNERRILASQRMQGISALSLPKVRTVADWIEWWTDNALTGYVAPTTERTYRDVARSYIIPHVGQIRLNELQPGHVTAMLRALDESGKATNTQRAARTVLSKALRRAEQEGLVFRNAARLADGPRVQTDEGRTLTPLQARRLIVELGKERYGAAFLLALTLGLRRGELLALRWSDLDRDRRTIAITRSLRRIDGRWIPQETKTRTSRRTLFVPSPVIDTLSEWARFQDAERTLAGPEWSTSPDHANLMFTTSFGTPIDGRNFHRYLVKATEAAGLGKWSPHELRHSAASLMLAEGITLKVVSETLGHSSVRVTGDIYGHLLEPARREASDAMSRALGLDEPRQAR